VSDHFELYRNFNDIGVRSFILTGAPIKSGTSLIVAESEKAPISNGMSNRYKKAAHRPNTLKNSTCVGPTVRRQPLSSRPAVRPLPKHDGYRLQLYIRDGRGYGFTYEWQ